MAAPRRRLWVVSELYHPEETSTGYFATGIAEGLADRFDVHVLCSQPTYSARGVVAPRRERRNGVDVRRCRGTRLDKDRVLLRLLNLITITLSIGWRAWREVRRGDLVLVVTNPPTLPFMLLAVARLRGARIILRLEDIYPDVLIATGVVSPRSLTARLLRAIAGPAYRRMDRVVVLGRDMATVATRSLGIEPARVAVIPHWGGDSPEAGGANAVAPELASVTRDRFVVQHMGNMGRTHAVEALAQAAVALKDRTDLHFLFIGWGARRAAVERVLAEGGLGTSQATVIGPVPRADVAAHMALADVAVIAFLPGMAGVSVPSRMYDVMAAGTPIVAVADEGSELALVVREEAIGWVVPPGDVDALVRTIRQAAVTPHDDLAAMGARARAALAAHYTRAHALQRYEALLEEVA